MAGNPPRRLRLALAALLLAASAGFALDPTEVKSGRAFRRLAGVHRLEWARSDWTDFGVVRVRDVDGRLKLRGYLRHMNGRDHLRLEGTVTEVRSRTFVVKGALTALSSLANEGKPFRREGEMTFRAAGRSGRWRLMPDPEAPGDEPLGEVSIVFDDVFEEARRARARAGEILTFGE